MGFVRRDRDTIVVSTPGVTVEVAAGSLVYAADRGGWTAVRWQGHRLADGYRFPITELAALYPNDALRWLGTDRAFVVAANVREARPSGDGYEIRWTEGRDPATLHVEHVRTARHPASEPPFRLMWQDELPELAEIRVAKRPLLRDRAPYVDLVVVHPGGTVDEIVLDESEPLFRGQPLSAGASGEILGLYVDGTLVTGEVYQRAPHAATPFLYVRGDLRCKRIAIRGTTVVVGGNVTATDGVYVFGGEFPTERRGALSIGGQLNAPLLYVGRGDVFGAIVGTTSARVVAADPRRVKISAEVDVEERDPYEPAERILAELAARER